MEKKYHIVIPKFESKEIGLKYLSDSQKYFSFSVDEIVYDMNGVVIERPSESTIISIKDIFLGIYDNSSPGVLYIESGFIKYYKIIWVRVKITYMEI